MLSKLAIRQLVLDDLPLLESDFPAPALISYRQQLNRQSADGYSLFGIFVDDQLAGVAHVRRQGPYEPAVYQYSSRPELGNLYVIPAYRGHGLAEQLIQAIESTLVTEGYRSLGLVVSSLNAPARHLYEKLGYHIDRSFPARPNKNEAIRLYYSKQLT